MVKTLSDPTGTIDRTTSVSDRDAAPESDRRPSLLATIRQELHARRAARAARRRLERELASYRHPAEIDDLEATLARYDEDEVADIRRILHRNSAG